MKALFTKVFLLSIMSMLILSCQKDEVRVTATDGKAAVLTASSSTLVLTKADATKPAITFTLTAPDYGYDAAVSSTLQLAVKGSNFANPKEFSLDAKVLSKTFTVIDFNALLLAMNLIPGSVSDIEARIKSSISAEVAPVFSNATAIKVTPYALISFIYVPGDYQGWNPGTADSLISATSNGIYQGVINYAPGGSFEFKLTPEKKWDLAYGDAGGGKLTSTGGSNLKVPSAGSYMLTANLNTFEFTAVKYSFGLVGDSPAGSNWGGGPDIAMKYDNGKRIWSVTADMGVGKFKFRLNSAWDTNFGDDGNNGSVENGGADIPIAVAGTYKIELNLVNNTYTKTKL
jgi:starch-binding outer membrane protein SusE/F